MNREKKFRIRLEALEPIGGWNKGEVVTIINDPFDRLNGVAFLPINKGFKVLSADQYTGLKDKNGKELDWCEGDILGYDDDESKAVVVWDDMRACFGLKYTTGNDTICDIQNFHKEDARKIGNIYDNPELLSKEESV